MPQYMRFIICLALRSTTVQEEGPTKEGRYHLHKQVHYTSGIWKPTKWKLEMETGNGSWKWKLEGTHGNKKKLQVQCCFTGGSNGKIG